MTEGRKEEKDDGRMPGRVTATSISTLHHSESVPPRLLLSPTDRPASLVFTYALGSVFFSFLPFSAHSGVMLFQVSGDSAIHSLGKRNTGVCVCGDVFVASLFRFPCVVAPPPPPPPIPQCYCSSHGLSFDTTEGTITSSVIIICCLSPGQDV